MSPAPSPSPSVPSRGMVGANRALARPAERLPERKPFPLEWFFPAMLVGTLGAIIGLMLPGQPWQPGALIGFFLVILPMKK
ncbi:MAG: hypothetical protein AB7E05_06940 [Sphingobium sp.]